MIRNLASWDRLLRVLAAVAFGVAAVLAPVAPWTRLAAFGGTAVYLAFTALSGTCLGYRLMGASTCPTKVAR